MAAEGRVRATLNYSVDNGRRLDFYFYEPAPAPANPGGTDRREVWIEDAWPWRGALSLDREGFTLVPIDPGFRTFDRDEAIRAEFRPQVQELIRKHTGARRVEVFDHTLRRRMPETLSDQSDTLRPAVQIVHSDYTPESAPQRVRDLWPEEADTLLAGRVAFYNLWKPLYHRVEELPLAVCDAGSTQPSDCLPFDLKYRERTGEIYVLRHAATHRWSYFPSMEPGHALLLKTYDSADDGRARFAFHSAFEHPDTAPDARPRESIEVRVMAFF